MRDVVDKLDKLFLKFTSLYLTPFLKKAEIIYILGFGFHQINLERLNFEELEGKKIIETVFGIDNLKDIQSLIDKLKIKNSKMKLRNCMVYDLAKQNDFLNY